jgi:hypothetical protein
MDFFSDQNIEEIKQDNSEYYNVLDTVVHINDLISKYFDFIDELWKDEIVGFNSSNDCYINIDDTYENKIKFINLMLDTKYYNQLLVSKNNFERRLEKI